MEVVIVGRKVTEIVEELIEPYLLSEGLELIDIEYKKEGSSWFLRVFIDKDGGIDIEDCGRVSEFLSETLDKHDPISTAYFLEVSSPGAERPLKKTADFHKAIGKAVHVTTYEPVDGEKMFEGKLIAFDEELLVIETKVKTRSKKVSLPYSKIASARLSVLF